MMRKHFNHRVSDEASWGWDPACGPEPDPFRTIGLPRPPRHPPRPPAPYPDLRSAAVGAARAGARPGPVAPGGSVFDSDPFLTIPPPRASRPGPGGPGLYVDDAYRGRRGLGIGQQPGSHRPVVGPRYAIQQLHT